MARGRPHKCPYCEATTSVAKGFRYNRAGKVRLRRCKSCGRRWTVGPVPADIRSDGVDAPKNEASANAASSDDIPPEGGCQEQDGMQEEQLHEAPESEQERRIELSLGGEGSPSQDDPGEERKRESEETFFTQ